MGTGGMDELAALRLQIEWGADEALLDAPQDRERPRHAVARAAPSPAPDPARPAAACKTIEELRAALETFDGCALRDTASRLVFAEGDLHARLMLVTDPPSADDDRAGRPLAGPDGAYLDRMLASVGLTRAGILLAPMIPWRPPGGRPPSAAEIAQCLPFLHRLVAIVQPQVIAISGTLAAKTLLGGARPRAGGWCEVSVAGLDHPVRGTILPSPAMLMRAPGKRCEAWATLCRLRRALDEHLTRT